MTLAIGQVCPSGHSQTGGGRTLLNSGRWALERLLAGSLPRSVLASGGGGSVFASG